MSKKLQILKASLEKKQLEFNKRLTVHMDDVRGAQGEPMGGHRGGEKVLRRWEKQNSTLKTLDESIKKTQNAIEREEYKIANVESAKDVVPALFLELTNKGVLNQWRKHPTIFFVAGVDKARIGWDDKKKTAYHRYYRSIECEDQKSKFKEVWTMIYKQFNEGTNQ